MHFANTHPHRTRVPTHQPRPTVATNQAMQPRPQYFEAYGWDLYFLGLKSARIGRMIREGLAGV